MLTFGFFGILIVHATDGLAFAVQRACAAGAAERTVMRTIIPRSVMVHSIALGRDAVKPVRNDRIGVRALCSSWLLSTNISVSAYIRRSPSPCPDVPGSRGAYNA
jgi:hypothetical protein